MCKKGFPFSMMLMTVGTLIMALTSCQKTAPKIQQTITVFAIDWESSPAQIYSTLKSNKSLFVPYETFEDSPLFKSTHQDYSGIFLISEKQIDEKTAKQPKMYILNFIYYQNKRLAAITVMLSGDKKEFTDLPEAVALLQKHNPKASLNLDEFEKKQKEGEVVFTNNRYLTDIEVTSKAISLFKNTQN